METAVHPKSFIVISIAICLGACGTAPDKFQSRSGESPADFMRRMTIETSSGVDQAIRSANLPSEKDGVRSIYGTFLPFGTRYEPKGAETISTKLQSYCKEIGGDPALGTFTQKLATGFIAPMLAKNQFKGGTGISIWCRKEAKILFNAALGNDNSYAPAISYFLAEPITQEGQSTLAADFQKASQRGKEKEEETERQRLAYEEKQAEIAAQRDTSRAFMANAKVGEQVCSQPYAYGGRKYVGYIEDKSGSRLKILIAGSASGIMREFRAQEIHWVESTEWGFCR